MIHLNWQNELGPPYQGPATFSNTISHLCVYNGEHMCFEWLIIPLKIQVKKREKESEKERGIERQRERADLSCCIHRSLFLHLPLQLRDSPLQRLLRRRRPLLQCCVLTATTTTDSTVTSFTCPLSPSSSNFFQLTITWITVRGRVNAIISMLMTITWLLCLTRCPCVCKHTLEKGLDHNMRMGPSRKLTTGKMQPPFMAEKNGKQF